MKPDAKDELDQSEASERPARRGARDLAARAVVLGLLGRIRNGAVIVQEGGRRHLCGRPVAGEPVPEVEVRSPRAWRAVATGGSAGIGRAYFSGWWRCASPDDLTMFLRVVVRNLDAIERTSALARRLGAPLRRRDPLPGGRQSTRGADRRSGPAHYELGNELFALFLDETMTYSGGLFAGPNASLRDAQVAKLDRICRKLALSPADHVLEIGTGWGSFALHAAGRYGCRVTTATTSPRQHEFAARRVKDAGLEDLVTVVERDYRDLTGTYDKLVSIEMLETLDERQHAAFFSTCAGLLEPDGAMALQAVVVADRFFDRSRHADDFVRRYVLPGSSLPSVATLAASIAKTDDLDVVALDDIGHHAAETFRRWRESFAEHAEELPALGFDETFRLLFEFYLSYREASFAERRIGDVQCLLAKAGWRPNGLTPPGG